MVSEAGELALDAAVSPARVLPCKAGDELADFAVDARAGRSVWVGPVLGDQAPVPGQESGVGDEAVAAQFAGEEPGQGGQERSVGPGWAAGPSWRRAVIVVMVLELSQYGTYYSPGFSQRD